MISTSTIAQSGMIAASNLLRASANNIANQNTDGFKKDVVVQKEAKNGGVKSEVRKSEESTKVFKADSGDLVETSNVRTEEEIVNQIVGKHQFSANLSVLKSIMETEGEIVDIIA